MNTSSIRLPGIVSDIDGVLLRGKTALKGAADCIRFLKTPLNQIDRERFSDVEGRLPFVCLTNAGGCIERQKADSVSKVLQLTENHEKLTSSEIILNYTPLTPIMKEYQDRLILLGGIGDHEGIAKEFGLQKYITDEEYCALFPFLVPYGNRPNEGEMVDALRKKVTARLGLAEDEDFQEPFQVHAIFIINDPMRWDDRIQIFCDMLSTSDGKLAKKMPMVGPETHIPVYCANNDYTYAGTFRLPRITFGCFNEALKQTYKLVYKKDLELNMYGKPCKSTYDYTEKHVRNLTNFEISNFYMIGDNPKSDIRGGNTAGWTTILVKTGVFGQNEDVVNDPEDPATYVVEDITAAIKLICELEAIKCELGSN